MPLCRLPIGDEEALRRVLQAAAWAALQGDPLLTIGIRPTGPETGYGYIEQGDLISIGGSEESYRIRSIREKPPREKAEQFPAQSDFSWNSAMFVWKASTIIKAIGRFLHDLKRGLLQIRRALGTDRAEEILGMTYPGLQSVSIDYGVMEKAKEVLVIPGAFDWSDLGSWNTLWEVSDKDENGNAVRGEFIGIDATNSLGYSLEKLVALVGVQDLLVVETKDTLLICRRGRSQDVRKVVQTMEKKGLIPYS